jgi:hypothetical protein
MAELYSEVSRMPRGGRVGLVVSAVSGFELSVLEHHRRDTRFCSIDLNYRRLRDA